MFYVDGYTINLSRGDTGAIRVKANASLGDEAFTFGTDDRALFSVKNGQGETIIEHIYQMEDNEFTIYFNNSDTDNVAAGAYTWDIRYIINPYYDANNNIIDGDQVITPKEAQTLNLLNVVGEV